MTNLPLLVLLKIFEKIDFINLIKLRLICKDWKQIIDNHRIIKELKINDKIKEDQNSKIENLIYLDQFKLPSYEIFDKIISSKILHSIKYLYYSFECEYYEKNKLIHLNYFELLEHLVLNINSPDGCYDLKLVHPNLKYLSVSANSYEEFFMEINCPKCEKLEIGGWFDLSHYDIVYPERIKMFKLAFDYDLEEDNDEYEIDKFINIEHLEILVNFRCLDEIKSEINGLNKLKKVGIKYEIDDYFDSEFQFYIAKNIRDFLFYLINKNLQISFNDKEIKNEEQIKKIIDEEFKIPLDLLIFKNEHDLVDSDYFYDLHELISRNESTDSDN